MVNQQTSKKFHQANSLVWSQKLPTSSPAVFKTQLSTPTGQLWAMDYLIRLVQIHPDFRVAEIRSLASLLSLEVEMLSYSTASPFLILRILSYPRVRFASTCSAAKALVSRSVLSLGIYELWGMTTDEEGGGGAEKDGSRTKTTTYAALHDDVRTRTDPRIWSQYREAGFKFSVDAYCGKRSPTEQTDIINGFRFLGFEGPIRMHDPEVEFTIFEEWSLLESPDHQPKLSPDPALQIHPDHTPSTIPHRSPHRLYFGRFLSPSSRHALMLKHDLKRRPYISTTSMDAVLALVSANLAHAGPGRLVYDPFVGTGGFLVAAAEFGAYVWGSDIDGRSFRGTGRSERRREGSSGLSTGERKKRGLWRNFDEYGLLDLFGDCFVGDLVNTPLLPRGGGGGWLDAIICDPPYGVREGLKVLGNREPGPERAPVMIDGVPAHTLPGYVAPKKPYSFARMLDDILAFAAETLVVGGRLAFWMPSANEDDGNIAIPARGELELLECCVQRFNRWSRRLLVYRRRGTTEGSGVNGPGRDDREEGETATGKTASDLNPFRRKYFQGFQT